MAGHSKWANIKHRKEKQDAAKGKIFTKLIRAVTVAAKHGGSDINANSNLRLAVDKAMAGNMSRDTIDRAIKRGAGDADDSNIETIYYEGYGPNGVAVFVECMTDNRNRTVSDVRHAFTKAGGSLGADGSVSYLFKKQGIITFAPGADEIKIMEIGLEAGADDVITNDDNSIDVITSWENFSKVKDAIENIKLNPVNAETTMLAIMRTSINDIETAEKIIRLIDTLEELDDVQNVYSNEDIDSAILEKL